MSAALGIDPPVWHSGAFVRLWIAQAITQTAQNAIWYALLVVVEENSHSHTQLGITILAVILPSVLFGIPAGVYVDRWDKRTVLVVTNVLRCGIVAAYIPFGTTLAVVYVVTFIFSFVSQFFGPAETAMIPRLVGKTRLMQANSFFHLTFTVSQLLGLVLVGPLFIKLFGTSAFFALTALLFGASGVLVWWLPSERTVAERTVAERAVAPQRSGVNPVRELLGQLGEVSSMLRSDRGMLWAMGYVTVAGTLTLILAMLAPGFAVQVLGIAAADAVFVMAPAGLGILVAATVLSRATGGFLADRPRVIVSGLIVVSIALAAVAGLPVLGRVVGLLGPEGESVAFIGAGQAGLVLGVMGAALLSGFGFAAILVAAQTDLQERAPADARGRVFAVMFTIGNLFSMVPLVLIGGVADLIGVTPVLLLMSLTVLGVAVLSHRRLALGAQVGPGRESKSRDDPG